MNISLCCPRLSYSDPVGAIVVHHMQLAATKLFLQNRDFKYYKVIQKKMEHVNKLGSG
jgi:hypothetical protein